MAGCSVLNWLQRWLGKDLSIMDAMLENGLWLTCNMGNCHSIGMADSTHQFLQMKILPSISTSTSQELQKMDMFTPRMWLMSWQLQRWNNDRVLQIETTYIWDGNVLTHLTGVDLTTGILPLVKITQDESTFTMYDWHWTKWDHADAKQPEEKNEGPSLMILGMLTQEWDELEHNGEWVGLLSLHILHLLTFGFLQNLACNPQSW